MSRRSKLLVRMARTRKAKSESIVLGREQGQLPETSVSMPESCRGQTSAIDVQVEQWKHSFLETLRFLEVSWIRPPHPGGQAADKGLFTI